MRFSVQPYRISGLQPRVLLAAGTDNTQQGDLATVSLCMTEAEADELEQQLRTHREQRRAVGAAP